MVGPEFKYRENGINFQINYPRITDKLKVIEVYKELNNPIIGGGLADGSDIIYTSKILTEYGPNIFYDALPFENLHTAHTKPQVMVKVDDMPAVCASVQCDFTYTEPTSEVDNMGISNLDLTITGIDLPTGDDLLSVKVAKTDCLVTASSDTEISCTLQDDWVHGDWTPEVRNVHGLAPVITGFNSHAIQG